MTTHPAKVLLELDARGVATVTLNRPDVNNAYDGEMLETALAALETLAADPAVRAVLFRGTGRHFQAGADLDWLQSVSEGSPQDNLQASRTTADLMQRINLLPAPTVALVQGACFGGGVGLIASCDVVIAADTALFSIAESRWGMMAGIILPQLNDAIGVRQVRRYALTGERFDAAEARRIGLVNEVVPLADLHASGARILDALLRNGPQANVQTKAVTLEYAWADVSRRSFDRLVAQHAAKRQSPEAAEGLASFREKRAASWYPDPTTSSAD